MGLSVTLPDDLAARLAEEAERRNVSSDVLVASYVEEKLPKKADVSSQPGLVNRPLLAAFIGGSSSGKKWSVADVDDDEYKRQHGFGDWR